MSNLKAESIPTLTDVVCPGETLRTRGLWLRKSRPGRPGRAGDDWQARLPPAFRNKAEDLLHEVRDRALIAAHAGLARKGH